MESQLNQYSDQYIETTGFHGSNISSQRIDELDQKALEYVLQHQEKGLKGIDLGCGFGIQGIRFALLHAEMELVDILEIEERIKRIAMDLFLGQKLTYVKKDIKKINVSEFSRKYDFVYSQRFLHYLNFQEASDFISFVSSITTQGGRLFISASGIGSELGIGYKGKSCKINTRFFPLSPKMASKHGIFEKVCLYAEDELYNLLSSNHFSAQSIWKSPFGNIKAIAIKQ